MKKIIRVTTVLMAFLLFATGCAIQMKPRPSTAAIDSIGITKIAQKAHVVISAKDLVLEQSVHFGLMGYLFPVNVKVGETLKVYSEEYFGEIFNEVVFSNPSAEDITVTFEIKSFDISAIGKAAHLELPLRCARLIGVMLLHVDGRSVFCFARRGAERRGGTEIFEPAQRSQRQRDHEGGTEGGQKETRREAEFLGWIVVTGCSFAGFGLSILPHVNEADVSPCWRSPHIFAPRHVNRARPSRRRQCPTRRHPNLPLSLHFSSVISLSL